MIVKIPWKNGIPDLTEQERIIVQKNNIGFSGAGELNYNMPGDKAWVYTENLLDEIFELIKQRPDRFELEEQYK